MKKKTTEEVVEIPEVLEVEVKPISPVTVDFGRADLNELRDKLNELIARS